MNFASLMVNVCFGTGISIGVIAVAHVAGQNYAKRKIEDERNYLRSLVDRPAAYPMKYPRDVERKIRDLTTFGGFTYRANEDGDGR